ncbi:MAG: hypothetical protein CR988_04710 [Treponema sp.]|nr:MAG: hypothetical protein CR988_04710 [Treponema sp.]
MKKILLSFAFCLTTFLFASDPIEGYWKSMSGKNPSGYWYFYVENNFLCGVCLIAPKHSPDVLLDKCTHEYPRHPKGSNLKKFRRRDVPTIYGLKNIKTGVWKNGYVIDPRNGRYYICHISFKPADGKKFKVDTLVFRGETKFGFGKTVHWYKATVSEINKAMQKNISECGSDYAKNNPQEFFVKEK